MTGLPGPRTSAPPLEAMPRALGGARSFEAAAVAFAELVLRPLGLVVAAVSRVPYYSRGTHGTYYVLDDAIFACRRAVAGDAACLQPADP